MFFFFIILGLVIAIVSLSIKYFVSYARLASYKSYNKAARKEMKNLKIKDPHITCDYCGSAIDTSIHKVCPQCGGEYGKDKEWINRHEIDDSWVSKKATESAAKEIKDATEKAHQTAKHIKILILVLVLLLGSMVFIGGIILFTHRNLEFAKDEELNNSSVYNFQPVPYSIEGDGLIFECDDVKAELTGIYQDDNAYKFGYRLTNNSKDHMRIRLRLIAINNYSHSFNYVYETVKAGDSVTIYERAYNYSPSEIGSMIFSDFELRDTDYNSHFVSSDYVKITTNATNVEPVELKEGEVVFENDFITIYNNENDTGSDRYVLEIENKSDYNFYANCDNGKLGDKKLTLSGFYNDHIPAGCIYDDIKLYSNDDIYEARITSDKVFVSLSFKCSEHPEFNFSTGYFEIKQ